MHNVLSETKNEKNMGICIFFSHCELSARMNFFHTIKKTLFFIDVKMANEMIYGR